MAIQVKLCDCSQPWWGTTYNKQEDYKNGLPNFVRCSQCDGIVYTSKKGKGSNKYRVVNRGNQPSLKTRIHPLIKVLKERSTL